MWLGDDNFALVEGVGKVECPMVLARHLSHAESLMG